MRTYWLIAALAAAACDGTGGHPEPAAGAPADPGTPRVGDLDADGFPADRDCNDLDPAVATTAWAYVDADGDGVGAGELRPVCMGESPPRGWSIQGTDCDDADATRWSPVSAFADDDLDGVGAGPAQIVCTAGGPLPTGWAAADGDCARGDGTRWRELPYHFVDADGDLTWVEVSLGRGTPLDPAPTVCAGDALPPGYSETFQGPTGDCDDANPATWRTAYGWPDADGDGAGEGDAAPLCVGDLLPAGWVETGDDCAPGDGSRWQVYSAWVDGDEDGVGAGARLLVCAGASLPAGLAAVDGDCAPLDPGAWATVTYAYRDADGDGRTVSSPGLVCAGATLPAGYSNVASGDDCDDGDRTIWARVCGWPDADLDGVGADAAISFCTTGGLPPGFVSTGGDCAPGDPARWRLASYAGVDRDGDGVTVREPGAVCTGELLPDPYRVTLAGNDCDDGDLTRWRWVVLYRDVDLDGVGAGPRSIPCVGADLPAGWSIFGFDPDDGDTTVQGRDDVAARILLDL